MRSLLLFLVGVARLAAMPSEDAWLALDPEQLSEAWTETVETLAGNELVRADFVEERRSRLRRRPARFEGNLIYSDERGLSLFYDAVITSTVILDKEGVLRRSLEAERVLPVPMEEGGLHEIILLVFAMDLRALNTPFTIEGQREADEWALRFTPREANEDILGVRKVVLEGTGRKVETIQFLRRGGLDLRIYLENQTIGPALTPEELEERFR